VTVVVNNLIYTMGGRDGKIQERFATIEIYDPATDTWKKGTDMPTAREEFAANLVGGKIYVLGGYTTVERRGKKILKSLGTLEVYDPGADAWEQKAKMLISRVIISSAVLDGKIYVAGGQNNVGGGEKRFDIYDPATDTWTQGPDLREDHWLGSGSAAANGKIYTIGGYKKGIGPTDIVEEYNPATNNWNGKESLPTPRYHCGVTVPFVGGQIYMIGGSGPEGKVVSTVETYDPAQDVWTELKKMPTARLAFDTAVVRGKIYVIGGLTEDGGQRDGAVMSARPEEVVTATVEEYTAEGWPFAVEPQGKLATTWATIKSTD
jgi:N-acetylneuraminic acid mutarotase